MYFNVEIRLKFVLFNMLDKYMYFIAQIAENTTSLHWKKVKTGISDSPNFTRVMNVYLTLPE